MGWRRFSSGAGTGLSPPPPRQSPPPRVILCPGEKEASGLSRLISTQPHFRGENLSVLKLCCFVASVPVYHCVAEKTHICQKVQPSLISTPTNHYCRLKRRDQHKVVDTGQISPVIVVKGLYQELFNKLRNSRVLLCSKFDCHAVQCPLNAHFTDAFIIQSLLSIHTRWQITDFLLLT